METSTLIHCSLDELKSLIIEIIRAEIQQPQTAEKTLSKEEVCKVLKLTKPSIDKLVKNGRLTGYRVGKRVLYKETEVMNALEQIATSKYKRV